jgi:hypothetical protein
MQGGASAVLAPRDAFHRCAQHGLCSFYGLRSHGVDTPHGRHVKVWRSQLGPGTEQVGLAQASTAAAAIPRGASPRNGSSTTRVNRTVTSTSCSSAHVADPGESPGGSRTDQGAHAAQGAGRHCASADAHPAFTVVDVLLALQEQAAEGEAVLSTGSLDRHRSAHWPDEWHQKQPSHAGLAACGSM